MPQLVGLMVVGAGLYAAYRALGRIAQQVSEQMARAEDELSRRTAEVRVPEKDLGVLEWDEAQQVYRPRRLR
ncbi:MAG: hypothetical protein J0I57_10960 [Hyphomicrobium sp.]|uniref:hypothetical protein n=1 Tax=Hyphomicrobium sp. CS1BSMeth3 TaxID=1892844 RepID=UPI00086A79E1|nr:hypothetical protein [Hyphomicrobium sp. CS1BSMeth3]MBN9278139.1 hypothetical protein [Hyphomicrobium sp.]ODT27825.1 MAG: hypothetical protein ABS54_05790 [Hyphomicrobium sp. SCN 65-11]